jgi:hypothetical protein
MTQELQFREENFRGRVDSVYKALKEYKIPPPNTSYEKAFGFTFSQESANFKKERAV